MTDKRLREFMLEAVAETIPYWNCPPYTKLYLEGYDHLRQEANNEMAEYMDAPGEIHTLCYIATMEDHSNPVLDCKAMVWRVGEITGRTGELYLKLEGILNEMGERDRGMVEEYPNQPLDYAETTGEEGC